MWRTHNVVYVVHLLTGNAIITQFYTCTPLCSTCVPVYLRTTAHVYTWSYVIMYHHQILLLSLLLPRQCELFSLPPSTTTTTTHPINIQPQSPSQCFLRCAPSFQSQIENTHRPHSPHKATRTPVPPQHHGSTNHQFQSPTHLPN